ncbi:MAG: PmoA family protein [Actinomycetota bacterium]
MQSSVGRRTLGLLFMPPALAGVGAPASTADLPQPTVQHEAGQVRILIGGKPCARYIYRDAEIPRPYFTDLREPGGVQVTRTYPPVEGKDPTDHGTFHPGLWLAFGDLNGSDFWRNKARVEHIQYGGPGVVRDASRFAVKNRYLSEAGQPVGTEVCRVAAWSRPAGTLLVIDSEFTPAGENLVFGDQEEMGLGVRLATPLIVTKGGRIRSSEGKENEKAVRGTDAAWVDYSGVVDGRRVGIWLMPDPENFRPSWWHARDYGLLVANPFGRNALTGGEKSAVVVKKGETLRLRFGVLLHGAKDAAGADIPAAYADYLALLKQLPRR